jgi:hypothetical protein
MADPLFFPSLIPLTHVVLGQLQYIMIKLTLLSLQIGGGIKTPSDQLLKPSPICSEEKL